MKIVKLLQNHITLRFVGCLFPFFLSQPVFPFGVLMTTPQQRIELDIHRNESSQLPAPAIIYPDKPGEQVIRLDGLVKRPNGPNSVWVNGTFKQKASVSGVFIDANKLVDSAVFIKLTPGSTPLFIKPGQYLNVDKGDVTENYMEKIQPAANTIDNKGAAVLDLLPPVVMTDTD